MLSPLGSHGRAVAVRHVRSIAAGASSHQDMCKPWVHAAAMRCSSGVLGKHKQLEYFLHDVGSQLPHQRTNLGLHRCRMRREQTIVVPE